MRIGSRYLVFRSGNAFSTSMHKGTSRRLSPDAQIRYWEDVRHPRSPILAVGLRLYYCWILASDIYFANLLSCKNIVYQSSMHTSKGYSIEISTQSNIQVMERYKHMRWIKHITWEHIMGNILWGRDISMCFQEIQHQHVVFYIGNMILNECEQETYYSPPQNLSYWFPIGDWRLDVFMRNEAHNWFQAKGKRT